MNERRCNMEGKEKKKNDTEPFLYLIQAWAF